MPGRLVLSLLPVTLGLLLSACGDQSPFAPTAESDPSLTSSLSRVEQGKVRGPGGGAGGLKKDR